MSENETEPTARVTVQAVFPDGSKQTFTYPHVVGFKMFNRPECEDREAELRPNRLDRIDTGLRACEFSFSGKATRDTGTGLVYTVEVGP